MTTNQLPWQHTGHSHRQRVFTQSTKLQDVLYEIRGPVHAHAARLEAEGHRILKLNIGNPAPFGFEAPDVIMRDTLHCFEDGAIEEGSLTAFSIALEQFHNAVADRKLLLMAICAFSQWTFEQTVATYTFTEAECVKYLVQLDKLGIIELRPLNRYRLKLAKTFRWRPHGPVMHYFRDHAVLDYFSGGFDAPGEGVLLVHGSVSRALAPSFLERMQRVAQDFAQQHLADQKLPWAYLTRSARGPSMCRRLAGVDALEFASDDGLRAIVTALAKRQNRAERAL